MKHFTSLALLLGLLFTLNAQTPYSLDFDGVDDYVNLGQVMDFETADVYTVEAWIKAPPNLPVRWQQVLTKLDAAFTGWGVQLQDGYLSSFMIADYAAQNYTFCDGVTVINDNTWHHIAVVNSGNGNILFYIDGVLETPTCTGTLSGTFTSPGNTHIGSYDGSGSPDEFWVGSLDDLRVWSTARTQFEVLSNMNTCLTGTETGLMALYNFEDGTGSTMVTDATANAFNGTLTNMDPATDWVAGKMPTVEVSETACDAYTWIDGVTYTADTTAMLSTNTGVCDTTFVLNLTINTADTSVTSAGGTLTANSTMGTFQWLDCDNGNAPIAGETNATYTSLVSGNFAVEVTENGCVGVSACYNITISSLEQFDRPQLAIYPNPSNGMIHLNLTDIDATQLNVYNVSGQLVFSQSTLQNGVNTFRLDQAAGVYFVEVKTSNATLKEKLVLID